MRLTHQSIFFLVKYCLFYNYTDLNKTIQTGKYWPQIITAHVQLFDYWFVLFTLKSVFLINKKNGLILSFNRDCTATATVYTATALQPRSFWICKPQPHCNRNNPTATAPQPQSFWICLPQPHRNRNFFLAVNRNCTAVADTANFTALHRTAQTSDRYYDLISPWTVTKGVVYHKPIIYRRFWPRHGLYLRPQ